MSKSSIFGRKSNGQITKTICSRHSQMELMERFFAKFPSIKQAYDLAQEFRDWYDKSNVGLPQIAIERELFKWYDKVEKAMSIRADYSN